MMLGVFGLDSQKGRIPERRASCVPKAMIIENHRNRAGR